MIDPALVRRDALTDVNVGISVSDSDDLDRLGLNTRHADLAIGELARAVLIAGGHITYGGRLKPSGFTQQLMNEVRRYGTTRHSLTLCLAEPEHRDLSHDELDEVDRQLGTWGRLVTLDASGEPTAWRDDHPAPSAPLEAEERVSAYSGLRRHMVQATDARVLVGGQLRGFKGAMPGLIEEAILAVEHGQPLYLAGGFGGAATAVARRLNSDAFAWLPDNLPLGGEDPEVEAALDDLAERSSAGNWSLEEDGLTEDRRALLAASHRPGEIASLVVLGLAQAFSSGPESGT